MCQMICNFQVQWGYLLILEQMRASEAMIINVNVVASQLKSFCPESKARTTFDIFKNLDITFAVIGSEKSS